MPTPENEWCDYSDMRKRDCDHCRTGEINKRDDMSQRVRLRDTASGAAIPATYNGPCAAGQDCEREGQIWKDQWIVHTERGWAHEECA